MYVLFAYISLFFFPLDVDAMGFEPDDDDVDGRNHKSVKKRPGRCTLITTSMSQDPKPSAEQKAKVGTYTLYSTTCHLRVKPAKAPTFLRDAKQSFLA
jgi:hypothetical protein